MAFCGFAVFTPASTSISLLKLGGLKELKFQTRLDLPTKLSLIITIINFNKINKINTYPKMHILTVDRTRTIFFGIGVKKDEFLVRFEDSERPLQRLEIVPPTILIPRSPLSTNPSLNKRTFGKI
jgi:hypothetical protein